MHLAFCWAHGRRKLIKAKPQKGSPIVDEALLRIAALYKVEDAIRGSDPERRRAARQDLSRPLVDAFFAWLKAQAARVSRKSDLGDAMAYMLKRQDGFRLFLEDGRVDIDSNLVENAIRSPAMNRRNALFAYSTALGHLFHAHVASHSMTFGHPRELLCEAVYSCRNFAAWVNSDGLCGFVHGGTHAPGAALIK